MKHYIAILFFLLLGTIPISAQHQLAASGKVTNNRQEPIPGATIHLLNTNISSLAGADGRFTINLASQGTYILEISATGYATTNLTFQATGQNNELNIQLDISGEKLDEVVVAAQKREELQQEMPVSISALSSRQVRAFRLWDSKEITTIVPALYSANAGDNRNVTAIRGITTTSYDPAVTTYIDGVNQFGLDTYISTLFDIDRIEVLRGSQGTLYGRNAMGGVINIITRQPTDKTIGFAELNFGNYNQQRFSAGLRTPVVKNKLFIGAAALYNAKDGFYINDYNSSSYDKQHNFTGNYFLKYLAGKQWVMNLNVKHNNARNNGAFPLVFGTEEAFSNPYKLNQNAITTMVDNTLNTSLSLVYTGEKLNFSLQTAFQKNYRIYEKPIDGDFSPIDGVSIINDYGRDWNNIKVYTQELKFTSPAASVSPFRWTAGVYLFLQDAPVKQATRFGEDANMMGVGDSLFTLINTTKSKNYGSAVYGEGSYKISPKLEITAGVRYDYIYQQKNVLGEYQHDPEPDIYTIFPDTSANTSYSAFSPKLSVGYKWTMNNFLYITYSRGFRTGGLTDLSSDPSQPPLYAYKPEYSNQFELGSKNHLFKNRFQLNIAAFYSNINNVQVPTLILPDAVTIIRNTGTLISKGAEAEILALPFRNLQVQYNFGYTDATYQSYKTAQEGVEVNLKGKRQVFTPDITSMLAIQYDYLIGGKMQVKAIARGEWSLLGDTYFDLNNSIRQSSYSLFNARAGFSTKNYELMFWARNIFGKKYISYAYDFGAIHLGDPATVGISLSAQLKFRDDD